MTDAIPPLGAAATEPRTENVSSLSKLSGDYDSFLQLLTAQVSNQDPLEPMDSSTFVTQLAQLSQVEQSVKVNTNLETISAQIASATTMSDIQLIDREVTITGDRFRSSEGENRLGYTLAEEAAAVAAAIKTEDGTLVRILPALPTEPGRRHDIDWDGLDDQGRPVADQMLTVDIQATDADEAPVSFTGYVPARVDSVILNEETPILVLDNGETVASERILQVN